MPSKLMIFALFSVLIFSACSAGAEEINKGLPEISLPIGNTVFTLEIAATPEQKRIGLMNRRAMPPDRGMVFVYDKPERVAFWMKNTLLPLSIAFVSEDGTVVKIADMDPQTETHHSPDVPVKCAVEVNLGAFKKAGLRVGDTLPLEAKIKMLH